MRLAPPGKRFEESERGSCMNEKKPGPNPCSERGQRIEPGLRLPDCPIKQRFPANHSDFSHSLSKFDSAMVCREPLLRYTSERAAPIPRPHRTAQR